jgi:hypothetical protein
MACTGLAAMEPNSFNERYTERNVIAEGIDRTQTFSTILVTEITQNARTW